MELERRRPDDPRVVQGPRRADGRAHRARRQVAAGEERHVAPVGGGHQAQTAQLGVGRGVDWPPGQAAPQVVRRLRRIERA
eukprot:1508084-Prymnesium_polylepis.1